MVMTYGGVGLILLLIVACSSRAWWEFPVVLFSCLLWNIRQLHFDFREYRQWHTLFTCPSYTSENGDTLTPVRVVTHSSESDDTLTPVRVVTHLLQSEWWHTSTSESGDTLPPVRVVTHLLQWEWWHTYSSESGDTLPPVRVVTHFHQWEWWHTYSSGCGDTFPPVRLVTHLFQWEWWHTLLRGDTGVQNWPNCLMGWKWDRGWFWHYNISCNHSITYFACIMSLTCLFCQ